MQIIIFTFTYLGVIQYQREQEEGGISGKSMVGYVTKGR